MYHIISHSFRVWLHVFFVIDLLLNYYVFMGIPVVAKGDFLYACDKYIHNYDL